MIASRHDSANALHVIYNLPSRKCSRYIFSNLSLDLCFWRVLVGTPHCLFLQFALSCSFVVTLYTWCQFVPFPSRLVYMLMLTYLIVHYSCCRGLPGSVVPAMIIADHPSHAALSLLVLMTFAEAEAWTVMIKGCFSPRKWRKLRGTSYELSERKQMILP